MRVAIGCLLLNTVAWAMVLIDVCLSNPREGIWNLVPIALQVWLTIRLAQRSRNARVVARVLVTIAAVVLTLMWCPVMALGMSPGPYQFGWRDSVVSLSALVLIVACWVASLALGRPAAIQFFRRVVASHTGEAKG